MKLFLGGTCNNSTWRDQLIPMLAIDYFNPVVSDWTEECQAEEIRQRETCDWVLYTITPKMTGVYSIAEVVDDSNKRPEKTIFCYIEEVDDPLYTTTFTKHQLKSLEATAKMIILNGGVCFTSLADVAEFVNN